MQAAMYYDAKPSLVDGDSLFEGSKGAAGGGGGGSGSQEPTKYDFERAKLKFDRSTGAAASKGASGSKGHGGGGGGSKGVTSKRNSEDCSLLMEKKSYNEAVQMFDENLKRGSNKESSGNYMKTSMNLDGLKVSDDEVSSNGPERGSRDLV